MERVYTPPAVAARIGSIRAVSARASSRRFGASGDYGRGARRDHWGWDQARLAVPQLSRVRLRPARARTLRSRAPLRPPRPRGPNAGEEDRVEPASQFGELAPGRGQSPRLTG